MGYIQRQTWNFFHFFPLILILLWVLFLPYRRSYQYFRIIWFSRCFGYYRKTPLIVLINSNLIHNFKYDPIPQHSELVWVGNVVCYFILSLHSLALRGGCIVCIQYMHAYLSFASSGSFEFIQGREERRVSASWLPKAFSVLSLLIVTKFRLSSLCAGEKKH